MKTGKLIKAVLQSGSSETATAVFALIGGLAVGAALGVLFAPESGKTARKKIIDAIKGLTGLAEPVQAEAVQPEIKRPGRKPKSDIKQLIHEAHMAG